LVTIINCYPGSPSGIIALLKTQLLIVIKSRKKERKKNEKRVKKGTTIDHMKKPPKPCEVLLQCFFAKLNESMKLLRSERSGTRLGKKIF